MQNRFCTNSVQNDSAVYTKHAVLIMHRPIIIINFAQKLHESLFTGYVFGNPNLHNPEICTENGLQKKKKL